MKKIAILTSGGDAPGMNPALRAIVKYSLSHDIHPYVVLNGYRGLVNDEIEEPRVKKIDRSIHSGGTIIKSARLPEFKDPAVRQKAIDNLKRRNIEALVVIGGDGSYRGAQLLSESGIKTIGLPGTIDNDITSTDLTIGFATALDTIVDAIEKIRDTAKSHRRVMIVEVMGREAGDLAVWASMATRANLVSIKDHKASLEDMINTVNDSFEAKRDSALIIVTEHLYDVNDLAKQIESKTGFETRAAILGHLQRGGSPKVIDRVLATMMGVRAVDELLKGKTGIAMIYKDGKIKSIPILEALSQKRENLKEMAKLVNNLNIVRG